MDFTVFEQAGLTQGEAAELLGVSRIAFLRWRAGGGKPHPKREAHIKRMIALTKVAMKLNHLPHGLPPKRGHAEQRKQAIELAYSNARDAVEKLKAKRVG